MPKRVQAKRSRWLFATAGIFARRRRAEDRFRGLLECAPDAMIITESKGRIAFVNSQTEKLFGYSRSELIGNPLEMLLPDGFRRRDDAHNANYNPHLHTLGVGLESSGTRNDGTEFPVEISFHPLDADDGIYVAAAVRDITERKLAHEQITHLNHELEQALQRSERLATTGLLATTIAHEIANPLTAITNLLHLLKSNSRLDEDARSAVAMLEREVARIIDVARQTLGQQRESRVASPTDISQLLDETCAIFAARIKKLGIKVFRAYRCEGEVTVHPGEMRQVFTNLVANAIDAMPNGGELRLEVVHLGPTVRFTIVDTGCGIAAADIRQIYDPLFTTKGDKGTGIGLWLTKNIVERLAGNIEVSSSTQRGQSGTTFTIVLPAQKTCQQQIAAAGF